MTLLIPAAHLHAGVSGPASLVFSGASGSYLQATVASSTPNRRTTTVSFWAKTNTLASGIYGMFATRLSDGSFFEIGQSGTDDSINVLEEASSSLQFYEYVPGSMDEADVWNHYVVRIDTTQGTADDRIRIYKDNSLLTDSDVTQPSLNYDHNIFTDTWLMFIGKSGTSSTGGRFNGKLAFLDVVENASLDATSFAFDNSGVWTRLPYAGSYATHGFGIDGSSAFNTTAGKAYAFTTPGSVTLDFADLPPFTI